MHHIASSYSDDLKNLFKIKHLKSISSEKEIVSKAINNKKNGKGTAILVINGFLNKNEEDISEWEKDLSILWKNNPWYHLSWNSKSFSNIINPTEIAWSEAMKNTESVGKVLGKTLASYKKEIILCGHSLGARVIFHALKYLDEIGHDFSFIKEIHFLGGAVGSDIKNWKFIKKNMNIKIYNYYSYNDDVLKYAYTIGTFFNGEPIGRNHIDIDGIKNIDTTKRVNGHSNYKKYLAYFYLKEQPKQDEKISIEINL